MNYGRQFFVASAEQINRILTPSRWAFVASAVVLAALAAHAAYLLWRVPESYSDFIVGLLAWSAARKTRDYLMLFVLVFGFLIALGVFARISLALRRSGPSYEEAFHAAMVVTLIPAAMWLFGLVLTRNDSLALLYLSFVLVVAGVGLAVTLALRAPGFWNEIDARRVYALISNSIVVLCLAGLSGAALALTISRLGIVWEFGAWAGEKRLSWLSISTATCVAATAIVLHMTRSPTAQALEARLSGLLIAAQLLIPGLFLILLPTPWLVDGTRTLGFPITTTAWTTVCLLILIAYADLYRCTRARRRRPVDGSAALSPICVIAAILFLNAVPTGTGAIPGDDYHFGEFVVPWWSWAQHGLTPFWDYTPARGLVNYLPGALNAVMSDGTATSMQAVAGYRSALILLLAFPPLAFAIGKGPAFLALVIVPVANGLSEIDVLATAALCVMCELYLRARPVPALAAWIALGSALVLVGPGQGGLFVLATSPLGLILLRRAWIGERRRLIRAAGFSAIVVAAVLLTTPLGLMLGGAVRYGFEHSAVNAIANGVAWAERFGTMPGPNPWLWEIGRASWIAVPLVAGVLMIRAVTLAPDDRARMLAYSVPIFLVTLLFIMRAAGRIDVNMSRPGLASIWSLGLLLPLLLLAAQRPRRRSEVMIVFVSAAAVVAPAFGFAPSMALLTRAAEVVTPPADRIVGARIGLPNLGAGSVKPEHLSRLVAVRHDLDRLLDPGETYLDLTNRNAHYFYFDRPPPIEAPAFYNLYHLPGQRRAIAALERKPPPVVLAEADNIVLDGAPASLRAYLLYRYAVLNYVPAAVDGRIWLVQPDRLHRVGLPARTAGQTTEDDLTLLDRAFLSENLQRVPMAWGHSYGTLSSRMRLVARITPDRIGGAQAAEGDRAGRADADGASRQFLYDIEALDLDGHAAGLLSFAFECRGLTVPLDLHLYWATRSMPEFDESRRVRFKAATGRLIVPLDAAPRWLLAQHITKLRLDVADPPSCPAFAITDMALSQRSAADAVANR